MVLCPLEAVAYAILDITHKLIKQASINETKKSKNNLCNHMTEK